MDKMWYETEYYSAIRKQEIVPFAEKKMNLEGILLSEISQKENMKYSMYHLYVESKKAKFIESNMMVISGLSGWQGKWEDVGQRV